MTQKLFYVIWLTGQLLNSINDSFSLVDIWPFFNILCCQIFEDFSRLLIFHSNILKVSRSKRVPLKLLLGNHLILGMLRNLLNGIFLTKTHDLFNFNRVVSWNIRSLSFLNKMSISSIASNHSFELLIFSLGEFKQEISN